MATDELEVIRSGGLLEQMIPQVRQALEQGLTHEQRLRGLANEQSSENARLRRVLRDIDPDHQVFMESLQGEEPDKPKKPKKKQPGFVGVPRASGTATGFGISMERCEPFVKEILKQNAEQGHVTQRDIYRALDEDQGAGSSAFQYLRSIGFLRKAGRVPGGQHGAGRERWIVMDEKAFQRALDQIGQREDANGS